MANLKAMDSDWFAQTYMGRKSKVKIHHDFIFVKKVLTSCFCGELGSVFDFKGKTLFRKLTLLQNVLIKERESLKCYNGENHC